VSKWVKEWLSVLERRFVGNHGWNAYFVFRWDRIPPDEHEDENKNTQIYTVIHKHFARQCLYRGEFSKLGSGGPRWDPLSLHCNRFVLCLLLGLCLLRGEQQKVCMLCDFNLYEIISNYGVRNNIFRVFWPKFCSCFQHSGDHPFCASDVLAKKSTPRRSLRRTGGFSFVVTGVCKVDVTPE